MFYRVFEVLGKSEAKAEFLKYGVMIENMA